MNTRTESDSVGSLEIPSDAYYGVQTLRGFENFQITGKTMNYDFIKNITIIKKAAAKTNGKYGYIKQETADAIITACDEILAGQWKDQFITDAIQGGAGKKGCGSVIGLGATIITAVGAAALVMKKKED